MADCLILKKSNCKNCYKCIRHCPVKSIKFSGNQARVLASECILCGNCFVVCPQDAKDIVDDTEKVKVLLQSGDPVYVSLAPSFIANYDGVGIDSMRKALKKLGFYDVEETAVGATIVKKEYETMMREKTRDVIISSCCHTVNLLIQKYFPRELMYLADILSPMQAHAMDIKKRNPKAKVVFIGPCLSKKDEVQAYDGYTDVVMTFAELTRWLKAENIELEKAVDRTEKSRARFFPTTGGILKTMEKIDGYDYMAVDGIENCISALKDLENGTVHNCFIEMSACASSCIGGPVMEKFHRSPVKDYLAVNNYAGKEDFEVKKHDDVELRKSFTVLTKNESVPTEDEINAIMRQMGKFKPTDELNCGSCGYNSCREKAIAVYQGKAEVSMCLPYLKDKAESFSDNIVNNTPNGLIVLNEDLEVQQINKSARKIMNVNAPGDILGEKVVRILDPKDFMEVLQSGKAIRDKRTYLAEYGKYVEETILFDKDYRILICILRDVTDVETVRTKKEHIETQTVEIADKVIDKQMRVVQEIASLLGETVAETKSALYKLKESISNE